MPTIVKDTKRFLKDIKHLARKYRQLIAEVDELLERLRNDERLGDRINNLGDNVEVYKVRIANLAAKRGKSGGFRLIYYLKVADEIFLLTIYSKTQQENISVNEIQDIIASIESEEISESDEES